MYIQVDESGNIIPGTHRGKPKWYNDLGDLLSDEELRVKENLYKVVDQTESFDPFYQVSHRVPQSQWTVETDHVSAPFVVENIPADEIRERLISKLEALRYNYEVGGMLFTTSEGDVLEIDTTRESQSKILGVHVAVQGGHRSEPGKWKTMNGFASIEPGDMSTMALQTLAFVQSCYDRESDILETIMAVDLQDYSAAVTAFKSIQDNDFKTGWPSIALFGGEGA